jgi:putative transposase
MSAPIGVARSTRVRSHELKRLDVTKRFPEEELIGYLREAKSGLSVKELCLRHGFSEASYYLWRGKFGAITVSDAKRLFELGTENTRLKNPLAEQCWKSGSGARHYKTNGDDTGATAADAADDLLETQRAMCVAGAADVRRRASPRSGVRSQRVVAQTRPDLTSPASSLWRSHDLFEAASGRAGRQPQAGRSCVRRSDAAGTSTHAQEGVHFRAAAGALISPLFGLRSRTMRAPDATAIGQMATRLLASAPESPTCQWREQHLEG